MVQAQRVWRFAADTPPRLEMPMLRRLVRSGTGDLIGHEIAALTGKNHTPMTHVAIRIVARLDERKPRVATCDFKPGIRS
jgi:hypothetical protein